MQARHLNVYFFFLVLLLVGVTVFFIFLPFLTAIVAAAVLAVLFRPTYEFFLPRLRQSTVGASLATCAVVLIIIVTPILFALSLAIGEANHLYVTIGQEHSFTEFIESGIRSLRRLPVLNQVLSSPSFSTENVIEDLRSFSKNAVGLLQAAYQSVTQFVFWVFVMFFTLYYFLIDGHAALRKLMDLSPLRNEHETLLAEKFISMSRATLKGTLVVGVIQGLLGGLAFWIVGLPSPAIWGLLMILFSIAPFIGSAIIWFPAAVILFFLGMVWQSIFLMAVGFGVISLIDNILRPKLVGKDTQMHPLMVFFATLGGIALFGLPGFVIGPVIVSLFMALGDIYTMEFHNDLVAYNQEEGSL